MTPKQKMQKIIGVKVTESLVKIRKSVLYLNAKKNKCAGKIQFCDNRKYTIYHVNDSNVFFGYYDLQQYNKDENKLLAHIVKRNADPSKDLAEIVWIDARNGEFHKIACTQAWSWQQGARLRWSPIDPDSVLFNAFENGKYVLKSSNIINGETKVISRAVYDIDFSFNFGLSLNFSRLQRLRPGYGYSMIPDETIGDLAPANDGIIRIDLKSGAEKLLFSLDELATNIESDAQHYINHICISPKGDKFTFFHIWSKGADYPLDMAFYVANMDGTGLRKLESVMRVSHYSWKDNFSILATTADGKYIIYDVENGNKQIIEEEHLVRDGHPTCLTDGFLSDTYPLRGSLQYIFQINYNKNHYKQLLSIFSDPRCYGEQRCDLHPRVSDSGNVTIDSTVRNGVRSIVAFKINNDEIEI